jgi:hypothetical protein
VTKVLVVLGLAVAFIAGIGLGDALNDKPKLGDTQTLIQTIPPSRTAPVSTETVTLTISKP